MMYKSIHGPDDIVTSIRPILPPRVWTLCGVIVLFMGGISCVYRSQLYIEFYVMMIFVVVWYQLLNLWFNEYTILVDVSKIEDIRIHCKYALHYYPLRECSDLNKCILEYIHYVGVTDKKFLDKCPCAALNANTFKFF